MTVTETLPVTDPQALERFGGRLVSCHYDDSTHSEVFGPRNSRRLERFLEVFCEPEQLERLLKPLPSQTREIVERYFGLCGRPEESRRSVARQMGLEAGQVRKRLLYTTRTLRAQGTVKAIRNGAAH